MLPTYLPLIMLSQLLLVSLLFNIFLFRQNRRLIKTSTENLLSESTDKTAISQAEDLTLFIPQPIFKATPSAPTQITEAVAPIIEPAASIVEMPIIKLPAEKSTFDDINRLLNEISQIEHKMGLKDTAKEAS